MTKPVGQDANATNVPPAEASGADPFGFSPWLKDMPDVPLHPLMANPVTAMAATTAIGFTLAGQMAGMMLGAMQTVAEQAKAANAARMSDALRIAMAGQEIGHVQLNRDGVIERVVERETPEGGIEMGLQAITAESPWSDQLMQDEQGRWYKTEVVMEHLQGSLYHIITEVLLLGYPLDSVLNCCMVTTFMCS